MRLGGTATAGATHTHANGKDHPMLRTSLIALTALALAGCVSFSSSNPSPPPANTVVVPAR
jgi:hypothetical protein